MNQNKSVVSAAAPVKAKASRVPFKRRLIQWYAALLYNAHLKGFIEGKIFTGNSKAACVPGFNCYSCPGAIGACPLGSLQNALASMNNRIGFYMVGILMLYGLILGRTICGWLCPLGLIQELLHKIPTPKIRKNRVTRALSWMKYFFLVVFAMIIPLYYGFAKGMTVPGFCKFICPAGTFEGAIGMLSNKNNQSFFAMLNIFFTRKFVIMLIIGLACIFCYRSFCRFICPLGAIYGMFSKLAIIGIKVDAERCNGCGSCVRSCPMDVKHVGDHECVHCGKCMDVCHKGAISMKAGKMTLIAPAMDVEKQDQATKDRNALRGRMAWAVAIIVLAAALIYANWPEPAKKPKAPKAEQTATQTEAASGEAGAAGGAGAAVAEATAGEAGTAVEGAGEAGAEAVEGAGEAGAEAVEGAGEAGAEAVEGAGEAGAEAVEGTGEAGAEAVEGAGDAGAGAAAAQTFTSNAPIGYEVGNQLEDFTITCLDDSEFHLADYRGKVVFINLWATYCGPCVGELPHFAELQKTHADDVVVIACHSKLVVTDVKENLKDIGMADSNLKFAVDDGTVWEVVNGSNTLPQTIVLNRNGEVTYNQINSVTPEVLEALYEEAK